MIKPGSLRTALLQHLPDIANDPQKLLIFAERGRVITTGAAGNSWEYAYQLTVIVQDYAGDMNALTATVVRWLAETQPDLLLSPEAMRNAVRFEAELMTNELADVQFQLDVTETVIGRGDAFEQPAPPPSDPTALW
ncbi:phage tail protein [Dyella marensis]|uniref:phage tail protein n=1 Tax=Dyella marensis TaxID=500610 RepID=UPI0031D990BA